MKLTKEIGKTFALGLVSASLLLVSPAVAQEHHAEPPRPGPAQGGHPPEGHPTQPQRAEPPRGRVERSAPPKWQAHPAGQHPHGPMVRSHAVRVLAPRVVVRGSRPYSHWAHPEFSRPVYYWEWNAIRNVSCIAEDSYGDQYPVTEAAGNGFGLNAMTDVEDDALDRCYQESGQDGSCYLATCSHF